MDSPVTVVMFAIVVAKAQIGVDTETVAIVAFAVLVGTISGTGGVQSAGGVEITGCI